MTIKNLRATGRSFPDPRSARVLRKSDDHSPATARSGVDNHFPSTIDLRSNDFCVIRQCYAGTSLRRFNRIFPMLFSARRVLVYAFTSIPSRG
jgi:hypothetical protein